MLRVTEELDRWEEWDPAAGAATDREPWRCRELAADAGGDLRRARKAAARAEACARTTDETYRAAQLLARIEGDLGHCEAELRQARIVARLRPQSSSSRSLLRMAALCNERELRAP